MGGRPLAGDRAPAQRTPALARRGFATAHPRFRAGAERVLPHEHRRASRGCTSRPPARIQRLALSPPVLLGRFRARGAAAPLPLPASGDLRLLMRRPRLLPARSALPLKEAYSLWAPTYGDEPDNPLMRLEQDAM